MTPEDIIKACKTHDWELLLDLFPSDLSDMGLKIAATAIIGEHHPDPLIAEEYGLGMWKNLLSTAPTSYMLTMTTGAVSLADFTRAYLIIEKGIEDISAMSSVKNFVRENKLMLAQFFEHGMVTEEIKDQIKSIFGYDIVLNKKQKEDFFARDIDMKRRFKIEFIQSVEQVRNLVRDIFQLKESEFNTSFSMPSNMRGLVDKPMGGDGNIGFKDQVKKEYLQHFTEALNHMGIKAHTINYRSPYGKAQGIQIICKVSVVRDCLLAFRRYQTGAESGSDDFRQALTDIKSFTEELTAQREKQAVSENKDNEIQFPGFRLC